MHKHRLLAIIGLIISIVLGLIIYRLAPWNISTFDRNSSESKSANESYFGKFVVTDKEIYCAFKFFDDSAGIYRMDDDGKNITKISDLPAYNLRVYDNHLYFVNSKTLEILKMNLNGTEVEVITKGSEFAINQQNGDIYFSNYITMDGIFCLDITGEITQIYETFSTALQIQDDYLYFNDDHDFLIYRYSLDTKNVESVSSHSSSQFVVATDGIYYFAGYLYKVDKDSLEESIIIESNVQSFSINNGWIYFVTNAQASNEVGSIKKIRLDGSDLTELHSGDIETYNTFIYIAGDWIYLNEPFSISKLMRISANGKGYSEVILP
ncbi:MAG: DUF5050 domain-containing protein [Bacillota bacterium]|nr:DUF5050 domain-containing protein [Bacillota bacterium]